MIDGGTVSLDKVRLGLSDRRMLTPAQVDSAHPLPFSLRSTVTVHTAIPGLTQGKHEIEAVFEARPFGHLHLKVEDAITDVATTSERLPRDESDDYSRDKATFAAYNWILEHAQGIENSYLESNFATDKKASHGNIMHTRGKRVTAEATITQDVLRRYRRVHPEKLAHHYGVATVGAFLSGSTSNALQSANGITAMFIATGQDVANVAESSAGILYAELTPSGDLYVS